MPTRLLKRKTKRDDTKSLARRLKDTQSELACKRRVLSVLSNLIGDAKQNEEKNRELRKF